LGKNARDLFNKGYNFGYLKIDTTTKAGEQVEFKTSASHNISTSKLFGSIDVKYKIPKYGVTLTEKWNTDNSLGTEISVQDQMYQGTKLTLDSSFAPHLGKRTAKLKGEFSHPYFRLNSDVSLDAGPIVNGAVVGNYDGWLFGYQTGYDTQRAKMTQSNFSFGRQQGLYSIHTFVNDATEFGGSLHHRVNENLELGANVGWTSGEQSTRFGLAGLYKVDNDWTVRGKISNNSQLAVATTHRVHPHLKMTFSTLINLQNFNEGGHKFGFGLEYDPCC